MLCGWRSGRVGVPGGFDAMHVVGCDRYAAMRGACRSVWQFESQYCLLLQEAGKSKVIAVINPNSGPDFTGGDATVKCLPHLKAAGNTLIGYVATGEISLQ